MQERKIKIIHVAADSTQREALFVLKKLKVCCQSPFFIIYIMHICIHAGVHIHTEHAHHMCMRLY